MHLHKNHSMKRAGEAGSQRRALGARVCCPRCCPLAPTGRQERHSGATVACKARWHAERSSTHNALQRLYGAVQRDMSVARVALAHR